MSFPNFHERKSAIDWQQTAKIWRPPGYLYLAEAINLVGGKKYAEAWTGNEQTSRPNVEFMSRTQGLKMFSEKGGFFVSVSQWLARRMDNDQQIKEKNWGEVMLGTWETRSERLHQFADEASAQVYCRHVHEAVGVWIKQEGAEYDRATKARSFLRTHLYDRTISAFRMVDGDPLKVRYQYWGDKKHSNELEFAHINPSTKFIVKEDEIKNCLRETMEGVAPTAESSREASADPCAETTFNADEILNSTAATKDNDIAADTKRPKGSKQEHIDFAKAQAAIYLEIHGDNTKLH